MLWKERTQIIEAEQTRGNVGMSLFDFIGSDNLVLLQPEDIDPANDLL